MKLLGLLDLVGAILLLAIGFGIDAPKGLLIVISIYLIGKALIFIKDIASWFDLISGVLLILSFWFTIPIIILIIFAVLIGSKGLLTLLI